MYSQCDFVTMNPFGLYLHFGIKGKGRMPTLPLKWTKSCFKLCPIESLTCISYVWGEEDQRLKFEPHAGNPSSGAKLLTCFAGGVKNRSYC